MVSGTTNSSKHGKHHPRVPPNWSDVKVSPNPKSKVLVTGYDSKGRKQYIYNPEWVKASQREKFERVSDFKYPWFQRVIRGFIKRRDLSKECVIANMLKLMVDLNIRVGNQVYLKHNNSVGLTTMMKRHITRDSSTGITLKFRGKSGVVHTKKVTTSESLQFIRRVCQVDGEFLFYCLTPRKKRIDSEDINQFLKEHVQDGITSKDIRTHTANRIFTGYISKLPESHSAKENQANVTRALKHTASKLGHTTGVCKASYIAPEHISKSK